MEWVVFLLFFSAGNTEKKGRLALVGEPMMGASEPLPADAAARLNELEPVRWRIGELLTNCGHGEALNGGGEAPLP